MKKYAHMVIVFCAVLIRGISANSESIVWSYLIKTVKLHSYTDPPILKFSDNFWNFPHSYEVKIYAQSIFDVSKLNALFEKI